jgi:UDP:flavonoid glycosyltransferase YjiC (YdhE family)
VKEAHVAFILEPVFGHIVPTLGIAAELIRRAIRVSYAVSERFESRARRVGAEALIYRPLQNKLKLFKALGEGLDPSSEAAANLWTALRQEETNDSLTKLETLYERDIPDLIVYDSMSPAGKVLADKLGVVAIEHSPTVITHNSTYWSYNEDLVLVSLPRFFQKDAADFDDRFQFIGFIGNDRTAFFAPWHPKDANKKTILVTATTGLLPQIDFFRTAISAFGDSEWHLVLTIGDDIAPSELEPLPENCEINCSASNMEILTKSCLVIGQGGQGSALEALYCAVPQVLIPPSPIHDDCAVRIAELGVGTRLSELEATPENVRRAGISLLENAAVGARLRELSAKMREDNGAETAADLMAQRLLANNKLMLPEIGNAK